MGEVIRLPQAEGYNNFLELFLFEKKAEGKAPRTIHDYKAHVSAFFKRFPDALRSEKELRNSVLKYFSDDIKPATFNLRRIYLKAFFDFLVRENIIEKNPIDFKKRRLRFVRTDGFFISPLNLAKFLSGVIVFLWLFLPLFAKLLSLA